MPSFRLVPTKRFEDDFRDLPNRIQGQVLKALPRIAADPHRGQKLTGVRTGQWRYRVGDYRIRYDIVGQVVVLHLVRHRKEVYRA
jgi:mRNA interferase RelE/StbE